MFRHRLLIPCFFLTASTPVYAGEALEAYARRCDEAIGITVPDFICEAGTLVPTEHHQANFDGSAAKYRPKRACDRPNQLNEECDPGSRFQVLPGSNDRAFAVAHCRKQGLNSAEYGDIAVIQHNRENGATCFYQALADWEDDSARTSVRSPLKGDVKAPSKGTSAWPWMTPEKTARIGCVGCHDNGPIFRSPYLSRAMKNGKPLLPGAGDGRSTTINLITSWGRTSRRGVPTRSRSRETNATSAIVSVRVTSSSTERHPRARHASSAAAPPRHPRRTRTPIRRPRRYGRGT